MNARSQDPNVIHFNYILCAEKDLIKKRYVQAIEHYELAANRCQETSCTNYGALTQERLGDCYQKQELILDAQKHYKTAIELYDEWGARHCSARLRPLLLLRGR